MLDNDFVFVVLWTSKNAKAIERLIATQKGQGHGSPTI